MKKCQWQFILAVVFLLGLSGLAGATVTCSSGTIPVVVVNNDSNRVFGALIDRTGSGAYNFIVSPGATVIPIPLLGTSSSRFIQGNLYDVFQSSSAVKISGTCSTTVYLGYGCPTSPVAQMTISHDLATNQWSCTLSRLRSGGD